MPKQTKLQVDSRGRGLTDITARVAGCVESSEVQTGLCHVFIHHTSASLILSENADPEVCADLERFMARLVPDGDAIFDHVAEGEDDMPAHVRSVLTRSDITVPVTEGRLALGTWQGIWLWEHRYQAHQRGVTVTIQGE